MSDSLLRLLWALPLVLLVGFGAALLLQRVLRASLPAAKATSRLRVGASVQLSEHTSVHVIEFDTARYLVVESTQLTSVHATPDAPAEVRLAPAVGWAQRFVKRWS